MKKPTKAGKNASTSRDRAVFKIPSPLRVDLEKRHRKMLAEEIFWVRDLEMFRLFCNKHGINEGGKSIYTPVEGRDFDRITTQKLVY